MSDVEDLRSRLADWKYRLDGDDVHSIATQIGQMLWRSAFYRSINESRRSLRVDAAGRNQANASLHELVDEGYITIHAAAIRRLLVDKSPASGPKGVFSLYALVRDIGENAALFTRANVLAARSLDYDFQPVKSRAFEASARTDCANGRQAHFVSREGWAEAEYWHIAMDKLCGVVPASRSPSDAPSTAKLEQLLKELKERGRNVMEYVNKYVAHASTPESRLSVEPEHRSVSLAKLWVAERVVVRAANFVSHYLVTGLNCPGLPVPQFDQFEHLDQAFVHPSAFKAMEEVWGRHSQETHACQHWFWDRPLADESDVWAESSSE